MALFYTVVHGTVSLKASKRVKNVCLFGSDFVLCYLESCYLLGTISYSQYMVDFMQALHSWNVLSGTSGLEQLLMEGSAF
jgi:hypothetical protein